jgi:predicted transposase/invertase (TIGR01784 family)
MANRKSSKTSTGASSPKKFLDPKNDVVFKMFFGNKHHKNILRKFLEDVLNKQGQITEIKLLNPSITLREINEGQAILDVLVELENGEQIDVEMQMKSHEAFRERCLYYWSKLYSRQLRRGKVVYKDLRPTHTINVLNFNLFPEPEAANRYHSIVVPAVEGSNSPFTSHLRMHFIELPKLAEHKSLDIANNAVARWGRFMLKPTEETLAELSQYEPLFTEVQEAMADLSANQKSRLMADMREKAMRDQAQREDDAHAKGKEEGEVIGEARGEAKGAVQTSRAVAQNMLADGLPRESVCRYLNITDPELTALLASPTPTTNK